MVLEHLGDVHKELGESEKAIEYWKKALPLSEKEEGLKERVEQKIQGLKSIYAEMSLTSVYCLNFRIK